MNKSYVRSSVPPFPRPARFSAGTCVLEEEFRNVSDLSGRRVQIGKAQEKRWEGGGRMCVGAACLTCW